MASKNSFKLLEEEHLSAHPHTPPEIEQNIAGNMRVAQMVGNVLELYLPRFLSIFVSILGGGSNDSNKKSGKDSDNSPKGGAIH